MKYLSLYLIAITSAHLATAATVIYQDDFSGGSTTDLNGLAPDVRPGAEVWAANPLFKADGLVGPGANDASAWLPFTPQAGNIYTLTTTYEVDPASQTSWISIGFSNSNNTNLRFVNSSGYGTFIRRANLDVSTFTGLATNGADASSDLSATGEVTVSITLDATDANSANWTIAWSAQDSNNNTYTRAAATAVNGDYGDIAYIGYSRDGGRTGNIFSLELVNVPEAGDFALFAGAFAGLGLLLRRRRRRPDRRFPAV